MQIKGKKILIGVSGSISAYKSALLIRQLIKAGAEVQVIMSDYAKEFISPLTLSTLSKNPVYSQFVKNKNGEWTNHVELGLWADAFLLYPGSANTIAKFANGLCDNLLCAVYLSAKCPVFIAPAMDVDMFQHPSTQKNIETLKKFGNHIIASEYGELASGLEGFGRLAEPENAFQFLEIFFSKEKKKQKFKGKKILITAGPTIEMIDPVRYISNFSTGKMGYALAHSFANSGAEVVLISGPSMEKIEHPQIKKIDVQSAEEMFNACMKYSATYDIAVLSAAVADYTPRKQEKEKIKKNENNFEISLTKTKDILKTLGEKKMKKQFLVGFALETNNEEANAKKKIKEKNLDLIVLNSLRNSGAGFGGDTNVVTLIDHRHKTKKIPLKLKQEIAEEIVEEIYQMLNKK